MSRVLYAELLLLVLRSGEAYVVRAHGWVAYVCGDSLLRRGASVQVVLGPFVQ